MNTAKSKTVRFVVLTTQRTGSTWVVDRLNNISGIEGHGELFLDRPRKLYAAACCNTYPRFIETTFHGALAFRPLKTFRYLENLYERAPCCGYKLMYSHLKSFPEILAYTVLKAVRVVHLVRENYLDVLISEELAKATGRSHVTASDKGEVTPKVHLEVSRLIPSIQRKNRNKRAVRALLASLPLESIEMSYESLVGGTASFYDMLRFLGRDDAPIEQAESSLVKRQSSPRSEVIRNYDEVASKLIASGWERLLD